MCRQKYLLVIGTRPEAVKLAPVLRALQAQQGARCIVCVTGQHGDLLSSALSSFAIRPHYDLQAMSLDQNPVNLMARLLPALSAIYTKEKPNWVLVQGDTTTAIASALAASYSQIPLAHVEAGLRSYRKLEPFPEEINRRLISTLADLHFAPTETDRDALLAQGVASKDIYVTGNTCIDALRLMLASAQGMHPEWLENFRANGKHIVLVTSHRRENVGAPLLSICAAVRILAQRFFSTVHFVFPVHPNPHVQATVHNALSGLENVSLLQSLPFREMVALTQSCFFAITDSGGLQEELSFFGKPALVTRNVTDRPSAVEAAVAKLVGTDTEAIIKAAAELIEQPEIYRSMARRVPLFGDGHAATKIAKIIHSRPRSGASIADAPQTVISDLASSTDIDFAQTTS